MCGTLLNCNSLNSSNHFVYILFLFFCRSFSWELDPELYGDRHYNVFTREFYPSLEDIVGVDIAGVTDEDIDSAVLFGTLRGNVVGLRYYTGVVNNNEMVALQRQPNNPYDKNAVQVNNVNGDQGGHIKKELAACLAPIMDNKLATIEGVVPFGANNVFTMPVQLSFWGKEQNKQAVLNRLKSHGFKLSAPGTISKSGKAGTSYSAPVHAAVQMTTEQLKTEFDKLFEDLKEDDKTREMEAAEAVSTPLLPHQKQALAWMVSRENNQELPPFWEERENYFYNTVTNFAEKNRPENVLGGILADDMGLVIYLFICNISMYINSQSTRADGADKKSEADKILKTTLIICPLSVLSNWIDQFEQHVDPDVQLNLYVYYGSERSKDPGVLSSQDIVLTTYSVLASDYGTRSNSPLHNLKWLRVVLDEGHTIRNPNAQQTKAVLDLEAQRRWVLTGTPIQNSLKDLWSLLSFLKLKPFADKQWWHRTIQRPVTMGDQGGLKRLQSLIKSITLRRTKTSKVKGKPVLKLPERKVFIQHITFTEEENVNYNSVKNESMAKKINLVAVHIFVSLWTGNSTPEMLREKLIEKMKLVLSSGLDEECAICLDSLNFPVITHCAHVFCKPCICEVIQREKANAKCPLCRKEVGLKHLVECPLEESDSGRKTDQGWVSSSKINALMHALIELRKQNPTVKSLIISQFTKFLSLIEIPLKESGFAFTRLDGSMTRKKRVEAIRHFQSNETGSPTVMLLSLKAGGVGLNLTAASRVFLMDPAWNPAAEDQCFDRCHRLGQKQDVIITKFIVKNSVEENMLKIQHKKRELAARALGTKQSSSETKINDIKTLMDL
uniref:Helicase like transcription factor n=1 Tax=Anolis carolinensis TaxID=28377 RepID=A0A803TAI2_ANOCA